MDFRAAPGHSCQTANIMNFIQRIRASHLNQHGFMDVLVGIVLFEVAYVYVITSFFSTTIDPSKAPTVSLNFVIFTGLLVAPFVENLLLIGIAALHEKIFKRTGLFVIAPLLLTSLHFFNFKGLSYPIYFRVLSLFLLFFVYLKQYDLHKSEMGIFKALLLSSVIHFAVNLSGILTVVFIEPDFDAETIFSAQQGE
jgi:hypothetical protein